MLVATVEDARRALLETTVRAVHPAGPTGLWIELLTPRGAEALLVDADEVLPRLARGAPRPPRLPQPSPLAALARQHLVEARFQGLTQRGLDRIVSLEFAPVPPAGGGCRLVVELFGRAPNLFLVDASTGRILESARRVSAAKGRRLAPGEPYIPPPAPLRPDPRLVGDPAALAEILAPQIAAGVAPPLALRQALAGLTDLWAEEVVARATDGTASALARALADLLGEVESGPWEPRLILGAAGQPVAACPLRLRHLPDERQDPCPSLGVAVERLAAVQQDLRSHAALQGFLHQLLRRLDERLRTRRDKLSAESLEFARADTYRRMGEALVARQSEVPRGASAVTLPDYAGGPDATLTIPLDPALSPAANAERLFNAARRGRRGASRVAGRLAETETDLGRVQGWARRVEEAPDRRALETIRSELESVSRLLTPRDRAALGSSAGRPTAAPSRSPAAPPRPAGVRPPRGRTQGPEPRRFVSSEGLPILVGRDNAGNDHLTVHLARSEDLWLHVEGFPGSHVVVRMQGRAGGVPRRTLIEAAQLAAYYSQARSHGKVAVSYTLKKYVRKPRKSPPGLVTITQEKTVIVKPDKELINKLAEGGEEVTDNRSTTH